MTPERWKRVKELFHATLDRPPSQRAAFISAACGGDEALLREVEALIASHGKDGSFLDAPAYQEAADLLMEGRMELKPGQSLGSYDVVSFIGRGGMGDVYLGMDRKLNRKVALKVLPISFAQDRDRLRRFEQEARSASALNHPNIITIHDFQSVNSTYVIVTEFVEGETLRERLTRSRLPLAESLNITIQIADALSAAHKAGITHRDVKPENVMLRPDGYIKVLDFGLAKLTENEAAAFSQAPTLQGQTGSGVVMGTVGYMSPEQAEGRTVDFRSDIFSFGCVLYETVTGARAFTGRSSIDTLHQIIHEDPQPVTTRLPSAPPELQRIIRKCLQKDPDARYQSMKEIAIDLRNLRRELDSIPAAASTVVAAEATPSRKLDWKLPVAALVILGMAATGWIALRSKAAPEPSGPIRVERLTGSGNVIDATISPDGKYLAYVESSGGMQGLWLRQLHGSQPLALVPAAVVGYWGIHFSPDSSSIYYALKSDNEPLGLLSQIPILGGTPRPLLSSIDSSVTFSPDGRQLAYLRRDFPDKSDSSLMIAGVDGSNPHALATKHPPEFLAPGFFIAPSWSPDGGKISVAVRNSKTSDAGLATIDTATGAEHAFSTRLLQVTFTDWLRDGSGILFVTEPPARLSPQTGGQIWRQPLQDGNPKAVTNDLVDYRNVTASADGRSLVTVGTDDAATLWIIPLDGKSEARKLPSIRNDGVEGLAWDRDGSAVYTTRVRDAWQIVRMNMDGTERRELTTDDSNTMPQITPDGKTIIFASDRAAGRGIWRMNADGTNPKLIVQISDPGYLSISPDGRTIFFSSAATGAPATWRVSVDGGTPQLVKSDFDREVVSPDGRQIAGVGKADGHVVLAVVNIADGKIAQAFIEPLASQQGALNWTADGKGLLFTTAERSNIWLQKLSGGDPVKLTNFSDEFIFKTALSPDGKSLLAARGSMVRDAFLITNFH